MPFKIPIGWSVNLTERRFLIVWIGQNTVALHPKGKEPAVDCDWPYACGAEMRYDRMGRLTTRGEKRNKEVISHPVT